MRYQNYEFEVYRNKFPPYDWLYTIRSRSANIIYHCQDTYKTENKAVRAVFEHMDVLTEQEISKENILPRLN